MKTTLIALVALLSFGAVTNLAVPEAKAQDFKCFGQYNGLNLVQENLTSADKQELAKIPRSNKDQYNSFILYNSVKKTFKGCLNYSNDFVGFDRVITRRFKYIYTAKNTAVYLNYNSTKAPFLMYKRLVITFEPSKIGPAIITVSSVPIPPPVGP
jgi:hypothetical protein